MGTKAAVETAIRAIYPLTTVEEWFEYGGEPYHFRLNINITSDSGDKARQKRVLDRMNFYKSLRSHNDGVRYFLMPEKSWAVAGGGFVGSRGEIHTTVTPPELKKPGAGARALAYGALTGTCRRVDIKPKIPPLEKPGAGTQISVCSKTYGGAGYAINGVPDIGADTMITKCSGVSTDFSKIEIGEAVWCKGHIGVYIGGGLAVECTPSWKNCVQVTACNCTKSGYNRRNWTKHGKLPYVTYTGQAENVTDGGAAGTTQTDSPAMAAVDKLGEAAD